MSRRRPTAAGVVSELWLVDGSAPTRQHTTVRVWWSRVGLGVRFDAEDDDPWATLTGHDQPLWQEEVVELFFAPGVETPREYFEIQVNPLGAVFDARVTSPHGDRREMTVDTSWHCAGIEVRAEGTPRGWSAEVLLPWSGLGIGEKPPRFWRANFYRIDRPRDARPVELGCWSPTLTDPGDFHRPARFGVLELDGLGGGAVGSGPVIEGVPRLVVPS